MAEAEVETETEVEAEVEDGRRWQMTGSEAEAVWGKGVSPTESTQTPQTRSFSLQISGWKRTLLKPLFAIFIQACSSFSHLFTSISQSA